MRQLLYIFQVFLFYSNFAQAAELEMNNTIAPERTNFQTVCIENLIPHHAQSSQDTMFIDTIYETIYMCLGDSVRFMEIMYTDAGVYERILTVEQDIFILVILTIIIENTTVVTVHIEEICEGDSIIFYGQAFYYSGE